MFSFIVTFWILPLWPTVGTQYVLAHLLVVVGQLIVMCFVPLHVFVEKVYIGI